MGKVKATTGAKCRQYVSEFGDEVFSTDGKVILCKLCNKAIICERRSQVLQHLKTTIHESSAARAQKKSQQLISTALSGVDTKSQKSAFSADLCEALVSADIPIFKVQHNAFKAFLEKYTNEKVPDESGLRKNYFPPLYDRTINDIRACLAGKNIWISADETTDALGRYLTNVIVGSLDMHECAEDAKKSTFLLHSAFLEQTNHSTIVKTINDALQILWPEGIQYDQVLLFVSDAAPYMVKAGSTMKVLFTRMIHLTCLDHGLNRVCEKIREMFPLVNTLISSVKKVFVKAPTRRQAFFKKAAGLALPPEPIITRWGTWLDAALYYAKNFDVVSQVVNGFDEDDSSCIKKAQDVLQNASLKNDLAYIKAHFSFLIKSLKVLEGRMNLTDSVNEIQTVKEKLESLPGGRIKNTVTNKFQDVLRKNQGWEDICVVADILSGKNAAATHLSPTEVAGFSFAPITSCDVERSFSRFKAVLRKNRERFTMENIKMYLVVHCNKQ